MDRLLNVVDAELNNHFKEEALSSTLFASAWFITIFTNSLKQNAENMVLNESLLQLWDYFMVAGWNAVLKMGIYILCSHSKILKQMPFEDILPEINEFVCSTLVQSRDTKENLYKMISHEFKALKLSFHIERLQIEFE